MGGAPTQQELWQIQQAYLRNQLKELEDTPDKGASNWGYVQSARNALSRAEQGSQPGGVNSVGSIVPNYSLISQGISQVPGLRLSPDLKQYIQGHAGTGYTMHQMGGVAEPGSGATSGAVAQSPSEFYGGQPGMPPPRYVQNPSQYTNRPYNNPGNNMMGHNNQGTNAPSMMPPPMPPQMAQLAQNPQHAGSLNNYYQFAQTRRQPGMWSPAMQHDFMRPGLDEAV